MGRIVEPMTTDRRRASGRQAGAVVVLLLCLAARSPAGNGFGDGDEPELSPPSEMPLISKPAAPVTIPPRPARPARGGRAVLALPGITTPSNRPSAATEPDKPALESPSGGLSLDAPIEMRPLPDPTRSRPNNLAGRSTAPPPLVLESSPIDESGPLGGSASRANPSTKRTTASPRAAAQPVPPPSRRPRLFGLMPGAARAPASESTPSPPPAPSTGPPAAKAPMPGRSMVDDFRDDPAVDSALKGRIERQARQVVGDRARSIEVRVVGKDAVVQAHGVKFYQKRGVRKSLEGIPALSGLRSSIAVLD